MSRRMMINGAGLVVIALVLLSAYLFLDRITGGQCRALRQISNDPWQNERLRIGLSEFVNDEANRLTFQGLPFGDGYAMRGEYLFDKPFLWLSVLEDYPALDVVRRGNDVKLVLRTKDGVLGGLKPPYRFSEVGIYAARSFIMYKNENSAQYFGGKGADTLSQTSYVKCDVSFESGSPFD